MNTQALTAKLKKHPFSAICGALAIILVVVYVVRRGAVPTAEGQLAQKTSESRRLKANISHSAQLKDDLSTLEDATGKIDQRLMRASDLAKNQQYFYKIETETGVKLLDLRAGGAPTAAPARNAPKTLYSGVPYTCSIQGTYAQLLAFLQRLEQGEHFQRLVTGSVSVATGSSDAGSAADPILSMVIVVEFLGQS